MLAAGLAQPCAIDGGRPGPGWRNAACAALSPDGGLACGHEHGSSSNQVIQPVSAFPLRPQVLASRSTIEQPTPSLYVLSLTRGPRAALVADFDPQVSAVQLNADG